MVEHGGNGEICYAVPILNAHKHAEFCAFVVNIVVLIHNIVKSLKFRLQCPVGVEHYSARGPRGNSVLADKIAVRAVQSPSVKNIIIFLERKRVYRIPHVVDIDVAVLNALGVFIYNRITLNLKNGIQSDVAGF